MKRTINLIFILIFSVAIFTSCSKDEKKDVQYATATGYVYNSQTGTGLANATLKFCTGSKKSTDALSTQFTIVADAYGYYYSDLAEVGTYTLVISAPGFYDQIIYDVVISYGIINDLGTYTIVANLGTSDLRIVLTWGSNPYDLDSHLTGPSSTVSDTRFHCYYSAKTPDPNVVLDVDDTYSYGPETTTILNLTSGTYRYSIFNYSDQSTEGALGIYGSPAIVQVYDQGGLVKTYYAPLAYSGDGNTWVVFEVVSNGTTYSITDVDDYVTSSSSYYVEKK